MITSQWLKISITNLQVLLLWIEFFFTQIIFFRFFFYQDWTNDCYTECIIF